MHMFRDYLALVRLILFSAHLTMLVDDRRGFFFYSIGTRALPGNSAKDPSLPTAAAGFHIRHITKSMPLEL